MTRFVDVFREIRRGFPLREIQASLRKQEGLTADQVEILTILSASPSRGQRMGDLSRDLQAHHTNVARTIRSLIAANYVERTKSAADGRGIVVTLSAEGKVVADRLRERRNIYFQAILDEFPGEERTELINVLERLADVLTNVAADLKQRT